MRQANTSTRDCITLGMRDLKTFNTTSWRS